MPIWAGGGRVLFSDLTRLGVAPTALHDPRRQISLSRIKRGNSFSCRIRAALRHGRNFPRAIPSAIGITSANLEEVQGLSAPALLICLGFFLLV